LFCIEMKGDRATSACRPYQGGGGRRHGSAEMGIEDGDAKLARCGGFRFISGDGIRRRRARLAIWRWEKRILKIAAGRAASSFAQFGGKKYFRPRCAG